VDPHLTRIVRRQLGDGPVRILDAGCGRMWTWNLDGIRYHLTGVDVDADALRLRVTERGDLDEAIVGDLRTVPLPAAAYDIVHSAFVLEHVRGAEIVLDRMLASLRPGGLMVLKIPDGRSAYGFLARRTPHRLHVLYKRKIRHRPLAGTPGHGPYPVVYDAIISGPGILAWARKHDLEVLTIVGENGHLDFFGRLAPAVDLGLRGVATLSFGHLTARYANLAFAFRKRADSASSEDG
jgi:SAM-dependent methyltransferase